MKLVNFKMMKYLYETKLAFKSKFVYRFDLIIGILATFIQVVIYIGIWKALYGNNTFVDGISFEMVTTNFILGLAIINAYQFSDLDIQNKLKDGSIANEFLKPNDFKKVLLARNLGLILFKLLTNFLPAIFLSLIMFPIFIQMNLLYVLLFVLSLILGMITYWCISMIVQLCAFWIWNVWSISTIKNVIVSLFSGALIPLWFMPEVFRKVIEFTPFYSIYYGPLQIYLGNKDEISIIYSFLIQLAWISILFLVINVMWYFGKKRIVVQGG